MVLETHDLLSSCERLSAGNRAKLGRVAQGMPFVADISRSDLLLYVRCGELRAVVVAHAQTHSILPVHLDSQVGHQVDAVSESSIFRVLRARFAPATRRTRGSRRLIAGGAPVMQQIWPIRGDAAG